MNEEDIPDTVKSEDKPMIMDILTVMKKMDTFSNFTLNIAQKGYELLAWIKKNEENISELFYDEPCLIEQVNELRVKIMSFKVHPTTGGCLRIRIISMNEPCMISETILMKCRKRTRIWKD